MAAPKESEFKPLFVLIAEDEQSMIDMLKLALTKAGHRIAAVARTGSEAVELARTTRIDLAILDVEMPRMNGLDAAREILAIRDVPLIISTGRSDAAVISAAQRINIKAFLVKPFRPEQLASAIAIAVSQHQFQREAQEKITALSSELESHKTNANAVSLEAFGLTKREREVLELIAQGKPNSEIATELGASTRTIDKHVEHILAKLDVKTRTAAAARALQAKAA